MTKLFIATPMYGGMCAGYYAQSLLSLQNMLRDNRVDTACSFLFNESLIQRARNALVQGFLKTDFTHLMFIDADIKFNPQDVLPMVLADKPIICGVYPKKEINWNMVHKAALAGVPPHELRKYTGSFVINLVGYKEEQKVELNQPVEIWNGGTGFMLIKRRVLQDLALHLPYYINDVTDLNGGLQADKITEFFPVFIEQSSRRLLSEDYAFCTIARSHGYDIWGAPWARLSHIGTYVFDGRPVPAP